MDFDFDCLRKHYKAVNITMLASKRGSETGVDLFFVMAIPKFGEKLWVYYADIRKTSLDRD